MSSSNAGKANLGWVLSIERHTRRTTGATLATIHFQAVSNRSYTVQYSDSLNPPAWQHLEHVVARQTNYIATVNDPASVPKRFYRLATPAIP